MRPEASVPLLAWLAVTDGPGAPRGQVFTLQRETLIGRKAGQIVLAGDAYVSGQHAKVRLEPSEGDEEKHVFVLYDLASANGTYAGSRKDYRDNQVYRHELEDGDFILLGETTLVFKQVKLETAV
jgi:pSer/pThr/pTyr-binding forkhead associated (FHA) protein